VNKLDELRHKLAKQQQEAARSIAAQEAADRDALEIAIREDLPKWTSLLEAAIDGKISPCRLEVAWSPGTSGGIFSSGRPSKHFLKAWPSIDLSRLRTIPNYYLYASRITAMLGEPFRITYHEDSELFSYFEIHWR
jgi:hypothetical protein